VRYGPRIGEFPVRGSNIPNPAPALDGQRFLIVEDEDLIAMEVRRWLRDAGTEVIRPVPTVEQALSLLEDRRIDAAVLDFTRGERATAVPIADKRNSPRAPRIFATGDVQISRGGDAQAPYLINPLVEAELVHAVAKLIARA
jgi:DNA-binding response OmpR family regulator